jgi:hypothetical protein
MTVLRINVRVECQPRNRQQQPQIRHLGNFRLKQAGDIGNFPLPKPIELVAEECIRTSE